MSRYRIPTFFILAGLALTAFPGALRAGDPPEVAAAKHACDAKQWAECQHLGTFYRDGKGVDQDYKKAFGLFKKACDGGELKGCRDLAEMYRRGNGVDQDKTKAGVLLLKVCDGGDAGSCFTLAEHTSDYGLEASRSAGLYEQACKSGDAKGCYNAGLEYREGEGVPVDMPHAVALFEKGCTAGVLAACHNEGMVFAEGAGVTKDAARAAQFFGKVCDAPADSDPDFKDLQGKACYNLGVLYEEGGAGLTRDFARAKALFERACQAHHTGACEAAQNVKSVAENAKVREKHPGDAGLDSISLGFLKGCDAGDAMQCRFLADGYAGTGLQGVPKNPARAAELYKRWAALSQAACAKLGPGSAPACQEVSTAYEEGRGVAKDAAQAAAFLKKSTGLYQAGCDKGVAHDCSMLGFVYQYGNGVAIDVKRAAALFKKACDGGDETACKQLPGH
jgi:TPR repeat protein